LVRSVARSAPDRVFTFAPGPAQGIPPPFDRRGPRKDHRCGLQKYRVRASLVPVRRPVLAQVPVVVFVGQVAPADVAVVPASRRRHRPRLRLLVLVVVLVLFWVRPRRLGLLLFWFAWRHAAILPAPDRVGRFRSGGLVALQVDDATGCAGGLEKAADIGAVTGEDVSVQVRGGAGEDCVYDVAGSGVSCGYAGRGRAGTGRGRSGSPGSPRPDRRHGGL
jgi:hypothetical protein